jgi:hypothetical protein
MWTKGALFFMMAELKMGGQDEMSNYSRFYQHYWGMTREEKTVCHNLLIYVFQKWNLSIFSLSHSYSCLAASVQGHLASAPWNAYTHVLNT